MISFTLSVTTINSLDNQAYQAFTTSQSQIQKFDENSPTQGETDTYEPVGEPSHVPSSSVVNNPSEGLYES